MQTRLPVAVCALMAGTTLVVPAAPDTADARLERWVTHAEVEAPESYENLELYPIDLRIAHLGSVLTLDDALRHGGVRVSEVNESGSVNTLLIENTGKQPVFIMAGEILSGAKQDRILQHDLWLAPFSGKVDIGAYCVEHGRWEPTPSPSGGKGTYDFASKATISNLAVRGAARSSASQTQVWKSVEDTNAAAGGVAAPTHALNDIYKDHRIKENVDEVTEHFLDLVTRHPQMTGVVVQVGDRILAADCFADRRVLSELWPKLLKSYALEAYTRSKDAPVARSEAARKFLIRAAAAESTREPSPGQGTLLDLRASNCSGEALVMAEGVAHLELFPHAGAAPEMPTHLIQPIRRNYTP